MAPNPAVMIAAKIGKGCEEPAGQVAVGPKSEPVLVEPDEEPSDQIVRVGNVLHIAPGEREESPLPAFDEPGQRNRITARKEAQVCLVFDIVRVGLHAEDRSIESSSAIAMKRRVEQGQVARLLRGIHDGTRSE